MFNDITYAGYQWISKMMVQTQCGLELHGRDALGASCASAHSPAATGSGTSHIAESISHVRHHYSSAATPCLPTLQQILCLSCTSRMLLAHPLLAPSNCTNLSAATGSETSHIAEMDSHVRHPSFLCCDKLPAYSAADSVLIMHFLPCTSHMRLAHHLLAPSIHRLPSVGWPSPTG